MRKAIQPLKGLRFTLQESFIALLPYIALSSSLTLASYFVATLSPDWKYLPTLQSTSVFVSQLFPLLLALSVSFQASFLFNTHRIVGSGLAILVFLVDAYLNQPVGQHYIAPTGMLSSLVAPILAHMVLFNVQRLGRTVIEEDLVGGNLPQIFNLLGPFFLSFVASIAILETLTYLCSAALELAGSLAVDLPPLADLATFVLANQLIWFAGVHGNNILNLLVSPGFLQTPFLYELSNIRFVNLFVGVGGSGNALAIALAVLIVARDRRMRLVAMAGLPFTLFNISEIIIYGLPLVLNLRLFIPFILVPLLSLAVAALTVAVLGVQLASTDLPWIAPVGLNAFAAGGIPALALQIGMITLATVLYLPFIRRFDVAQDLPEMRKLLGETLNLDDRFRRRLTETFQSSQASLQETLWNARKAIDDLRQNELTLHYQPLICVESERCVGFEALMRLRRSDGSTIGPYFLSTLEDAGFAMIIDRWVCSRALEDINRLAQVSPGTSISINLHPDSLADDRFVDWLIDRLGGRAVTLEVVERGIREAKQLWPNIRRLTNAGFSISIDNFGAGYSNLTGLVDFPVRSIKFDRQLLGSLALERGRRLYSTLTGLCQSLGYKVVAEGVEQREQLAILRDFGVNVVQGWYFAKAMPLDEALVFAERLNGTEHASDAPAC